MHNYYAGLYLNFNIKSMNALDNIIKNFNDLYAISSCKDVNELNAYYKNTASFKLVNINGYINELSDSLTELQTNCLSLLKDIIFGLGLDPNDETLLNKFKKVDTCNNYIKDSKNYANLVSEINSNYKIRNFVHQAFNCLFVLKSPVFEKCLIKQTNMNEFFKPINFYISKITHLISQSNRLQKEINLLALLSSSTEHLNFSKFNTSELLIYVESFKENATSYFFVSDFFDINIEIKCFETFDFFGDIHKIEEIIDVILNNACEELCLASMENNQQSLHITFSLEKANGQLQITIEDNGRGIKDINTLFKYSYTTKNDYGGSGIGLSIIKKLINDMNGHISAKSSNALTQFLVTLPLKDK
ncbi:MAG: sensor histidine kinase [Halarcobacter sp.]